MPRPRKLTRRDGTYYLRVHVPADLVAAMGGRREFWRSLGTKDYAEALRNEPLERGHWEQTFDDRRRGRELTDDDITGAVWGRYSAGVIEHDKERLSRPTQEEIDRASEKAVAAGIASGAFERGGIHAINAMTEVEVLAGQHDWATARRARRLGGVKAKLAAGDYRVMEREADAYLDKRHLTLDRADPRYRQLCEALMRGEIELLERTAERDAGDFTGKVKDPIVHEPAETGAPAAEALMVMFDRFKRQNPNNVRPETMRQVERDVQHFADLVGPRVRAKNITKAHVAAWLDVLHDWPVKASETSAFEGMGVRDVTAANKALPHPKPTIARQTIRRYMASLGGFCGWLAANDHLPANPVTGMLPKKAPPTTKRKSFTDEQFRKMLASPLFTTCQGDDWHDLDKPGNVEVRDARYWIPILMAYSGARPAEIAQLHVGDVRQQHDVWVIHITEEGGDGDKRTKTKSSMRMVPIHSKLIELGFVEYRNKMVTAGKKRLFPEIEIPKDGQIAAKFSREFNRYLIKIGIKTGPEIVTYSLRHTFIDKARLGGFMNEEIATVVGHDKASMTGRYGNEQEGTLRRRAEIIESVKYLRC